MRFRKEDTNAIKGIAIILMFFHHCFLSPERWATVPYSQLDEVSHITYFPISFAPFSQHIITYLASFSKVCVPIFVFLTGYGLMASYKVKSANVTEGKFIWNRLISMMSGFWFIFVVVQILSILTGRFQLIYDKGLPAIVRFVVDGMGMANLLNLPTFNSTWWYMSLALVLVFVFPMMYRWMQKEQWLVLVLVILVPRALNITTLGSDDFLRYVLAYVLGMYFSKQDLLVKIKVFLLEGKKLQIAIKFVIMLIGLGLIIKCRQNAFIGWKFLDIWEGVAATYVIIISYVYIVHWKIICKFMEILGKYSMDMFLIHTFYRDIFFHEFTYSFGNWFLILVVLLVISFVSSVLLEQLKKILKYQRFVEFLKNRV